MKYKIKKFIVFTVIVVLLLVTVNLGVLAAPWDQTLRSLQNQESSVRSGNDIFYIGYARRTNAPDSENNIAKLEFNIVTPENDLKMGTIVNEQWRFDQNNYNYGPGDGQQSFASQNNMKFHGHCLIWHKYNPAWVDNYNWDENSFRRYIRNVVTHYANGSGGIYAWDVVNEAFYPDGELRTDKKEVPDDGKWGESIWWKKLGENYIKWAFEEAHTADPTAKLIYNDYDLVTGDSQKFEKMLEYMKNLKDGGTPIDGIGFQMHITTEFDKDDVQTFADRMQAVAEAGFEVYITELDIKFPLDQPNPTNKDFDRQADIYRWIMKACLAQPACKVVQVWGFNDEHSWIEDHENTNVSDQGWAPLLFTGNEKKQAYFDIQNAMLATVEYNPSVSGNHADGSVKIWYHGESTENRRWLVVMSYPESVNLQRLGDKLNGDPFNLIGRQITFYDDRTLTNNSSDSNTYFQVYFTGTFSLPTPWDMNLYIPTGWVATRTDYWNIVKSPRTGKLLTVINDSNYADVVCQDYNSSWSSQDWAVEDVYGNIVRIRNKWSGKYLTVTDKYDCAPVKAQDLNLWWPSQLWVVERADDGYKRYKSLWSGRYLTVTSYNEGASVVCQNLHLDWDTQIWNFK